MLKYLTSWLRNNPGLSLLLVVSFAVYAPSLSGEFVIDDIPQVRDNPYIRDIGSLPRYFTKGLWENSSLGITSEQRYLPMTLVPMMLNYQLWGTNPFGYHLFLLLLHLLNAALVYALIRNITGGSGWGTTLGAAIFTLHPTKVGSVAWIIGGVEPLVTFFLLAMMLAHRAYVTAQSNGQRWGYLGVSLVCFQLAVWSKEVALAFPLIVAMHDLIFRKKIDWRPLILQVLIVAGYMVTRSVVLGGAGVTEGIDLTHFSRAIDFALGYCEMLVFPLHIPFYVLPPEHAVSTVLGWAGAIIILALAGLGWHSFDAQRRKVFVFAMLWAIVSFWPAILLMFYTAGFYSPRYLYVPSVGLALFVAILYGQLNLRDARIKPYLMVGGALIVTAYGFLDSREIPHWHDNGQLYKKVALDDPEQAVGFLGLGQYYFNHEDYAAAESNYLLALQKTRDSKSRVDPLLALGTINGINNKLDISAAYFQQAVKIDPENSEGWSGLGNLAWMHGQLDQAIAYYEKALSIRPNNYEAAMNLARAYDKTGQHQRADSIRQKASAVRR
jgi:hypothetical protein